MASRRYPTTTARPRPVKKAPAKKAAAPKKEARPKVEVSAAHKADMDKLTANFMAAAKRHGLCDTLMTEIDNLNAGLAQPLSDDVIYENARVRLRLAVSGKGARALVSKDRYNHASWKAGQREKLVKAINEALAPLDLKLESSHVELLGMSAGFDGR